MAKKEEFLKRLQETFRVEALEHLQALSSGLLDLERDAPEGAPADLMDVLRREVHSLKGAARAVNRADIEAVSHAMEDLFADLKRTGEGPTADLLGLLGRGAEALERLLADPESVSVSQLVRDLTGTGLGTPLAGDGSREDGPIPRVRAADPAPVQQTPADAVRSVTPGGSESEGSGPGDRDSVPRVPRSPTSSPPEDDGLVEDRSAREMRPQSGVVRVPAAKLDALLLQAEEMVSVKLTAEQHAADLREVRVAVGAWRKAQN